MMGGLRLSVISARMCLESDCRLLMLQQAPGVHPQQHRTSGPPPHQKSSQMTVLKQHWDCHMTHFRQEGVLGVPPVGWGGILPRPLPLPRPRPLPSCPPLSFWTPTTTLSR